LKFIRDEIGLGPKFILYPLIQESENGFQRMDGYDFQTLSITDYSISIWKDETNDKDAEMKRFLMGKLTLWLLQQLLKLG
jgi:hypothetical protein